MRRSAGILTHSHYVYLTRNLTHCKDLNFKTYTGKRGGWSTISNISTTAITGSTVLGGWRASLIMLQAPLRALLVDVLVIMPRWDAIMHCVSWLRSAVIYGQPALCYRTTAWDGWEWIRSSGKVAGKCWWQFKFEKYSLCCAVPIHWAMWTASLMRTQRTSWGNQAHIRAHSLFCFSDCFWNEYILYID